MQYHKIYPGSKAKALDNVSLSIESGEFFGLWVQTAQAKQTLISILATLMLPTGGSIKIDGELLTRRNDIKRKLALITQRNLLRNDMTLLQIMEMQARLYGLDLKKSREHSRELLEFCDLYEHRKKIVRERCSGGMKRKLMPCRALLTQPEILL